MLAFLKGKFVQKSATNVIIDVNGVGYDLHISLHTYTAIAENTEGLLFTHLHITENAHTLYGFSSQQEKDLFLLLISVSGVGASTAGMMLSGMQPNEIIKAIAQQNSSLLERIKGIGKKTAERLILELKDKLVKLHNDAVANIDNHTPPQLSIESDAINALVALGIAKPAAEKAVKKSIQNEKSLPLETLIKEALKNI